MTFQYAPRPAFHLRRKGLDGRIFMACLAMGGGLSPMVAQSQTAQSNAAPASPAAASAPAPAATPSATTALEKVVVTARKREELLVDVPISVLSYSERELRDAGITDLQSLKDSAGFSFQQSTLGSTAASGRTLGTIVFRGLQANSAAPRDNSGSLFVDGIFISGGQSSVNTIGLQRVEVLKGPQNTYFGRNTFGGAVNFITKNPPTTFGGEVNASVTGRGSSDVDGTIGGPLGSDALRGSVTVFNHNKVAQYHATDGGDLGAERSTGVTATLYATPTDKLWLRMRGHYQRDDDSSAPIGYLRGDVLGSTCTGQTFSAKNSAGVPVTFTPTVPYFCGSVPSASDAGGIGNVVNANTAIPAVARAAFVDNSLNDPFLGSTPTLNHTGMRRDVNRLSIQGGYDLPAAATLGFSLGYNEADSRSIWDLDRSINANFVNALSILSNDLTADVRAFSDGSKPLRALLGLSYFKSSYKLSQVDFNSGLGAVVPTLNSGTVSNDKADVPAIYGSIDYDIVKMLTVSAEARYQRDKASTTSRAGAEYEKSFSNLLPRVILQFKPNDDTNIYASWSKGVQPASFNTGYVNASAAQRAYISTIVPGADVFTPQPTTKNFEVGIKQTLLGGRLQYSLAAYQITWDNQVTLAAVFNPSACIAAGTFNTPACPLGAGGSSVLLPNNARIKGVEFSTLAFVNPNWNVGLNLDYKDARWLSFYDSSLSGFSGGATRFDGNRLSRLPAFTASANTTYSAPLTGRWNWFTRADVNYTGPQWESNANLAQASAYTRVNLHMGVRNADTTIEVFAKNLFDDSHWDYAYKLTDLAASPLTSFTRQGLAVYAPDRREIGVRLRQTF